MIRSWTATCAGAMPVFIAVPERVAKAPCVIVIHERYNGRLLEISRKTASNRCVLFAIGSRYSLAIVGAACAQRRRAHRIDARARDGRRRIRAF
jgi:hypothetical protein